MRLTRRQLVGLAGLATAMPAVRNAWAQTYPTRPVRLVVPFAAGGPTDLVARVVAQKLSDGWGQQIYVENAPGASGNTGTRAVARAARPTPPCRATRLKSAKASKSICSTSETDGLNIPSIGPRVNHPLFAPPQCKWRNIMTILVTGATGTIGNASHQ